MAVYLEHANMHVQDIDQMIKFIQTAMPSFKIRFDSGKADPERWVHIGDDQTYLALNLAIVKADQQPAPYSGVPQINHLGFVVNNVTSLHSRLQQSGYTETTVPNSHKARKRIYFLDPDGNDWEFIEYLTVELTLRNDYKLT